MLNIVDSIQMLLEYFDDTLISSPNERAMYALKKFLHSQFTIKNIGYPKYFLGLEIARSSDSTYTNQRK